nr:hypothetical protein [Gammaproteobacteria bacterium]
MARKAELRREFGLSRPTVYEARNTAGEVLREHFEKAESAYRVVRVLKSMTPSLSAQRHDSVRSNAHQYARPFLF